MQNQRRLPQEGPLDDQEQGPPARDHERCVFSCVDHSVHTFSGVESSPATEWSGGKGLLNQKG